MTAWFSSFSMQVNILARYHNLLTQKVAMITDNYIPYIYSHTIKTKKGNNTTKTGIFLSTT